MMLFKHSEIRSWSYMTAKFFNMVLYTETIQLKHLQQIKIRYLSRKSLSLAYRVFMCPVMEQLCTVAKLCNTLPILLSRIPIFISSTQEIPFFINSRTILLVNSITFTSFLLTLGSQQLFECTVQIWKNCAISILALLHVCQSG